MYSPSQTVEATQIVKFTTTVSGVGRENFQYQWRHNQIDINGEISDTLTVDGTTRDLGGRYECVVKNEYGDSATSGTFALSQLKQCFVLTI